MRRVWTDVACLLTWVTFSNRLGREEERRRFIVSSVSNGRLCISSRLHCMLLGLAWRHDLGYTTELPQYTWISLLLMPTGLQLLCMCRETGCYLSHFSSEQCGCLTEMRTPLTSGMLNGARMHDLRTNCSEVSTSLTFTASPDNLATCP